MTGIRGLLFLTCFGLCFVLLPAGAGEKKTAGGAKPVPKKPAARKALDQVFRGRVVSLEKRRVTLYYDFEDKRQLEDFEEARPPRLLDASRNRARIERGRLVLEGSTSIRHKMESRGRIEAKFTVRVAKKSNVGAVITEPVLSDFYVVYNLFDYRFNKNGMMHIAACGLHEDEGAEDLSTGLVNFRDIFASNLQKKVEVGTDVEVEIRKEGYMESFQVRCGKKGTVKGKGSSKGKTKDMDSFKIGFFVHGSSASFDDLTLTCDLSDEYLDLENLRLAVHAAKTRR